MSIEGAIAIGALGALKTTPAVSRPAIPDVKKLESAANHALSVAKSLARTRPRSASKLADFANRALAKGKGLKAASAAAAKKVSASAVHRAEEQTAHPTSFTTHEAAHPQPAAVPVSATAAARHAATRLRAMTAAAPRVRVHGDDWNFAPASPPVPFEALNASALLIYEQMVSAVNAVAQAGQIEAAVTNLANKLPAGDLQTQGNAIASRCDVVIQAADPNNPDVSVIATVSQIQSDANAWTQQANAALSGGGAPTGGGGGGGDSGGGGGGGGGGGDSGGGDSGSPDPSADPNSGAPGGGGPPGDMTPPGAMQPEAQVQQPNKADHHGAALTVDDDVSDAKPSALSMMTETRWGLPLWGWGAIAAGVVAGGVIYWRMK